MRQCFGTHHTFRGHTTAGAGDTPRGSSGHTARGINCKQLERAPGMERAPGTHHELVPAAIQGDTGDTPQSHRGHTTNTGRGGTAARKRPHPRLPTPSSTPPDRAREQGGTASKAPAPEHPFLLSPSIHAESSNPFFQEQSETKPPRATSYLAISSPSQALDPPPPQFCRHLFSPVSQHLPPKQWNQRGISRKL